MADYLASDDGKSQEAQMTRIIEIANQYGDGLITALEFRNAIILELMNVEDDEALTLLCNLILRSA